MSLTAHPRLDGKTDQPPQRKCEAMSLELRVGKGLMNQGLGEARFHWLHPSISL